MAPGACIARLENSWRLHVSNLKHSKRPNSDLFHVASDASGATLWGLNWKLGGSGGGFLSAMVRFVPAKSAKSQKLWRHQGVPSIPYSGKFHQLLTCTMVAFLSAQAGRP